MHTPCSTDLMRQVGVFALCFALSCVQTHFRSFLLVQPTWSRFFSSFCTVPVTTLLERTDLLFAVQGDMICVNLVLGVSFREVSGERKFSGLREDGELDWM